MHRIIDLTQGGYIRNDLTGAYRCRRQPNVRKPGEMIAWRVVLEITEGRLTTSGDCPAPYPPRHDVWTVEAPGSGNLAT